MKLYFAALTLAIAALPLCVSASASPKAIAVLAAEKSWLNALRTHDSATLEKLLAPNYVHVDSNGRVYYREDELRSLPAAGTVNETWGQQTVDFAGSAAIVHGVSTSKRNGKVVRERYVDVYEWTGSRWQALSAQETVVG